MMKKSLIGLAILSSLSLVGCGESSDSGNHTAKEISATFIDSPVAGVNYKCGNEKGVTDSEGKFTVTEGTSCHFDLNGFSLGSISNISQETAVVTPYDVANDAAQAVRIASILQTIDTDGNPENGITIAHEFDGSKLSPDLLKMNEAKFTTSLAEKLNINEEQVVNFDKAKAHLDSNVGEKKGYHSQAVEEIVEDITKMSPDIKTVNLQDKLAQYHQILDKGDDSNNQDIQTLQAFISIAEILNNPIVSDHLEFKNLNFKYTEMLPAVLDSVINKAKPELKTSQYITNDMATMFYLMAQKLVEASNQLGKSFADPNYVAEYGKTEDSKEKSKSITINQTQAKQAQGVALLAANELSTLAAYQYGDDDYITPKHEDITVKVIGPSKNNIADYSEKEKTISADYIKALIDPVDFYNNTNVGVLRTDPKYLNLAKSSLIEAVKLAETMDFDDEELSDNNLDTPLTQEQLKQEAIKSKEKHTELVNSLKALEKHLTSHDGKPFEYESDKERLTINLNAFYNLDKGIDKNDFEWPTEYNGSRSEKYSKLLGEPVKETTDYLEKHSHYPNPTKVMFISNSEYVPAISLDYLSPQPKDSLKDVIIKCEEKGENSPEEKEESWKPCF